MKTRTRHTEFAAVFAALALTVALVGCGSSSSKKSSSTSTTAAPSRTSGAGKAAAGKLTGLFKVTAGDCAAGAVTAGSYFRMVQSGGSVEAGPFIANADSTCVDKTWSALAPGTDGGLLTGKYQAQPDPPFDATKNGLANKVVQPVKFFAVGFAMSTNEKDPASGASVPAPTVTVDAAGKLSGDVRAVSVAWNGQQFNQGAPKPDGSSPGGTKALDGTYDASTGAYKVQWTSQIVGGPFNGFTGVWHLEGTFVKG